MEVLRQAQRHAAQHLARPAVSHQGKVFTYESLITSAEAISRQLAARAGAADRRAGAKPPRIGLYAAPGPEYVAGTLGIWQAGGIAVPLATSHPPPELDYVLQDAGLSAVLSPQDAGVLSKLGAVTAPRGVPLLELDPPQASTTAAVSSSGANGGVAGTSNVAAAAGWGPGAEQGALIIYTSGTTGRPKGALHTHRSLASQVQGLVSAWQWSGADVITHPLPLHHIHGIVNALYCPLSVGAHVDFLTKFSPTAIWNRILEGRLTVFMGVPTMYNLLLAAYDNMKPEQQAKAAAAAARLRLTVSGSSACPVPIMERWKQITGSYLLERYGMTEVGMALSNLYVPASARRPGCVGVPLPNVEAAIAEDGQLLLRGPNLFSEYWGRPEATQEAFDDQGFFKTGDTASVHTDPETGLELYTIMGRTSVDIIKSVGYKISALQVENVLLEHPSLQEVAVLGIEDDVYGEMVTALVVLKQPGGEEEGGGAGGKAPALSPDDAVAALREHCAAHLPPYKAPRKYLVIDALPRNAMGKVNKKQLKQQFLPQLVGAKA